MLTFEDIVKRVAAPVLNSKILTGDVLKVLTRVPVEMKFDVVIADPPYNIGKDFGTSRDAMPIDDYVHWTHQWLTLCLERLADQGLIYVYGFAETLARVAADYPVNEQRWLAWHYTNKAVPSSSFWQRSHESILCLWRPGTKRPALEVDQIREPYTETFLNCAGKSRKATDSRFGGKRGKATIYQAHEAGALPRDVLKVPALAGGAGRAERWFLCKTCRNGLFPPSALEQHRDHDTVKHPTQKPIELTKRLIRSRITGTMGRILVPFAGSGSECVVAQSLGVGYLGIELNAEYVDFARKWLRQTRHAPICTS